MDITKVGEGQESPNLHAFLAANRTEHLFDKYSPFFEHTIDSSMDIPLAEVPI